LEDLIMAVTRYEPWSVVSQLQNDINRVFGNLSDGDSSSATAEWSPAVDVREYSDRFQLLLDMPGVSSAGWDASTGASFSPTPWMPITSTPWAATACWR
jgi:HSP20 family protein